MDRKCVTLSYRFVSNLHLKLSGAIRNAALASARTLRGVKCRMPAFLSKSKTGIKSQEQVVRGLRSRKQ